MPMQGVPEMYGPPAPEFSLEKPAPEEILGASWRQSTIGSAFTAAQNADFPSAPDYPGVKWDDIKDNSLYVEHAEAFAGLRSPAHFEAMKAQIDRDAADRRIKAASGTMGLISDLVMESPLMALPGRVAIGVLKNGTTAARGVQIARGGAEVGLAAGLQTAGQEMIQHAAHPDRTLGESTVSIGSATILGGLLGAGMAYLSPAEKFALTTGLNVDRAANDAHLNGETLHEGFPAYHGSPFELESFDRSRINTGEGNQSFSHGIYVTDTAEVARFYAGMRRRQAERLQRQYDRARGALGIPEEAEAEAAAMATHPADEVLHGEYPSNVYQVHVHIDRDHFLDWDKPVSEQSQHVRDVLTRAGVERTEAETGQDVMKRLIDQQGPEQATKTLNDAGLPGVKYLDAKSRAAGEGTRNYVLYDEHKARVTHRNGEEILTREAPPPPAQEAEATVPGVAPAAGTVAREAAMGAAPGGAGVRDTRTMQDLTVVPTGIGVEKLRDNVVTRTLLRGSLVARRLATDLSETAVLVKGNLEGKTTTMNGMAPIQTVARTQQIDIEGRVAEATTKGWMETNFGGAANAPWFAKLRDDLSKYGVSSPAKVTYEDFSRQVSEAAMYAEPSPNPHIQKVVDEVRAIWDEYGARAEASVEGFKRAEQAPGESHFPHSWNIPLIQAKQPEFLDDLTNKFAGDQAANFATQGRIKSHQGALESHEGNIKKYTRQLEGKQAKLAEDELLQEEVRRQNKFGYQTAERLRESSYENVGGIRVEAPEKNIGKAQGGSLFETEIRKRGNELADRAAKHRAEVADLEEKLQAEYASADTMRGKIEDEIGKWHGTSTAEAKSAIKAREKYEAEREAKRAAKAGEEPKGGRLTSADEAVDRAVDAILKSNQELPLSEVRDKAGQALDHIISSPVGRLPFDEAASLPNLPKGAEPPLRGSLAERTLDVTNKFASPWIEKDIHKVMRTYARTFVPDVLLAERYGDAEMTNQFVELMEEYRRRIDAARGDEKEVTRLGAERKNAIADIAILRDRIRGLFQIPTTESQRNIGRISAAVRNFTHMAGIGMGAVSSIPDTAGVIARWGLNSTFKDAWVPFLGSLMTADRTFAKEVMRQMGVMRVVNETITASRHHSFHGVTEPYSQGSWFERTLQKGADITQLVNLMAPQTDLLKAIAGTVAATGIYRAAKRAAGGTATKRDLLQLGQANIRPDLYEHIVEQYEKNGTKIDGHVLPNTEGWDKTPIAKEARAAFEAGIHRDVDLSVVTPGIDKPAFISDPVMGVFTQFKSYTAAATTRILVANLQRSDAQTLQGLIASLGFGAMAYYVHSVVAGQPVSKNPADWAKESVSRGNILGWLDEANTLSSKMTRGKLDIYRAIGAAPTVSRTAGQSAVENLLGPTVGKLSNLTRVTGAMATGDVNAGDIHALRRSLPWNNMLFWNRALTEVEHNIGDSFGIKQSRPRAQ